MKGMRGRLPIIPSLCPVETRNLQRSQVKLRKPLAEIRRPGKNPPAPSAARPRCRSSCPSFGYLRHLGRFSDPQMARPRNAAEALPHQPRRTLERHFRNGKRSADGADGHDLRSFRFHLRKRAVCGSPPLAQTPAPQPCRRTVRPFPGTSVVVAAFAPQAAARTSRPQESIPKRLHFSKFPGAPSRDRIVRRACFSRRIGNRAFPPCRCLFP